MLKTHFSRFLQSDPQRLHFAAHSHHPWPDVTEAAHLQYWADSARLIDDKWAHIFSSVIPEAQGHLEKELKLPAQNFVFAANTHELLLRLLSCLPERPTIVTSDAEFHSFERQTRRLEEEGLLSVERVAAEPFESFAQRYVAAVKARRPNLAFVSQVFFNSGFSVEPLSEVLREMPSETMVVIDGYHGFCAVPVDLSAFADRLFYLAGGYKYAMAGEGACFMHVPEGIALRPRNTGWFASFGALESAAKTISYASGAARFFGATFDPSGLYRFNASMQWRDQVGCGTAKNREYAHALQHQFVTGLSKLSGPLNPGQLVVPLETGSRGQFLTFRTARAAELSSQLKALNVITDSRGDRLRFGFGVYQSSDDVSALLERVQRVTG